MTWDDTCKHWVESCGSASPSPLPLLGKHPSSLGELPFLPQLHHSNPNGSCCLSTWPWRQWQIKRWSPIPSYAKHGTHPITTLTGQGMGVCLKQVNETLPKEPRWQILKPLAPVTRTFCSLVICYFELWLCTIQAKGSCNSQKGVFKVTESEMWNWLN